MSNMKPYSTTLVRTLAGLFFLSALVTPVQAEMKALGNTGTATYYVDTENIKRNGSIRTVWSIMDYSSPQTTKRGASYRSTRTNMEFNCREHTVLMRQYSMHSGPMAQGEVIDTQGIWREAQAIPPGTPLVVIMKFVC